LSRRLDRAKALWKWTGDVRPPWAEEPRQGQESVWDHPRPPRVELERRTVVVSVQGTVVARTDRALRVLETASPPTVYLPRSSVQGEYLEECPGASGCEWKGMATYWSLGVGNTLLEAVGWSYEEPHDEYSELAGYLSFYPARTDCRLGDEAVRAQPGRFYGGWVTSDIAGPVKGEPGSGGW
jgi:uncharacterized protein (DUF427 family)